MAMEIEGLSKRYGSAVALADVTLTLPTNRYVTLLGPSGSGKSTLLRLLAGLEKPDAGRIVLGGEDITGEPPHRRRLGIVQQNYALFPHLSVRDNVAFGLRFRERDPITDAAEVDRRVDAMLELVGLEGLSERMTNTISGGQKQRVSLARTLVTEPRLILLDEPLGALDANLRERMTVELRRIRSALGVTFLHVTGNEAEALAMGDRMIVLDAGRAVVVDEPDAVFSRPATVRVARFLNAYNVLDRTVAAAAFAAAGALPPPAACYAVRFDAASLARGAAPAGHATLPGTFVTAEFMGSRIIYFARLAGGQVFEVERHLSRGDPETYAVGEALTIHWRPADTLAFDEGGRLAAEPAREVA